MRGEVQNEASDVTAVEGDVHVKGPDGVVVSLTPEAAAETSDRLLTGATKAQGQRLETKRKDEERRARHP